MRRPIKYILLLLIIGLIGYNSVYFRKISELKAAEKSFDAPAYAKNLVQNELPSIAAKAIKLDTLLAQLATTPAPLFKKHGHSLTIGSSKFFMVNGTGTITSIDDSGVTVRTEQKNEIKIATEYIFGNGIRDATGLINLRDFSNTTDLSNISSEINKIIRKEVVPPFSALAKVGSQIVFAGSLELNEAHLDLKDIELLPVSLQIIR
jgi:predicted lipoprotein